MAQTLLEQIKGLQYFRGLQDLRNILVNFLSTVTALQTNSVIVGKTKLSMTEIPQGTSFIAGKKYAVILEPGDNFSNIGYTVDNALFTATGTTPTTWINNSYAEVEPELIVHFNDIDTNLSLLTVRPDIGVGNIDVFLKITNNKFVEDKLYPSSNLTFVDTNTLEFTGGQDYEYLKIEVYN